MLTVFEVRATRACQLRHYSTVDNEYAIAQFLSGIRCDGKRESRGTLAELPCTAWAVVMTLAFEHNHASRGVNRHMYTYAGAEGVWRWSRAAAQSRSTAFYFGGTLVADSHGGRKPRSYSLRTSWTLQASAFRVWPTCKGHCGEATPASNRSSAQRYLPCSIYHAAHAAYAEP